MANMSENISGNGNNVKRVIKGSAFSIVITIIGILIYSIVLCNTSVAENSMPTVIIIITAISILIGSTISTTNINKNGILNGMFVGFTYIIIIYLLSSIITGDFSLNANSVIMIIASIIAGAVGGIIGVNKK